MAEKFYKKFIGRTMEVLFEHKPDKKTGLLKGLTGNYLSILARGEKNFSGQIMNVKIKGMEDKFLLGEIL
jgi:threonylcarbamoyladenosine tRNA methylthiotransferase MtaB